MSYVLGCLRFLRRRDTIKNDAKVKLKNLLKYTVVSDRCLAGYKWQQKFITWYHIVHVQFLDCFRLLYLNSDTAVDTAVDSSYGQPAPQQNEHVRTQRGKAQSAKTNQRTYPLDAPRAQGLHLSSYMFVRTLSALSRTATAVADNVHVRSEVGGQRVNGTWYQVY